MTTLAHDFIALATEWQAVDLHHVVEHAREHLDHLAEFFPVKAGIIGKRINHKPRQVE